MPDYRRILITGAAGSLGSHLRAGLGHLAQTLRLADIADLGPAGPNEETVRVDLSDKAAALEVTRDCDAILHFAGHPREQSFEDILADTFPVSYHVWEGARRHGARRVIYASSIHAVGFHPVESVPDTRVPQRPDTFYGLTKTFAENLASLYWDKYGVESVCLRICSCFPEPRDRRMLWSWLSLPDCVRLAEAALTAPRVGFSVIYGTSDNAQAAVSNAHASHIGFRPQDSADPFAAAILARTPRPDPAAPANRVVGGSFAAPATPTMPPDWYAALLATWPAEETERLGPWTLRRGVGGNRTSAATLDGRADASPEISPAGLATAETAMRAWGQRPLFLLRPGDAALDAALAARGYGIPDRTVILAASAAALAVPGGATAIRCDAPLAVMTEIWPPAASARPNSRPWPAPPRRASTFSAASATAQPAAPSPRSTTASPCCRRWRSPRRPAATASPTACSAPPPPGPPTPAPPRSPSRSSGERPRPRPLRQARHGRSRPLPLPARAAGALTQRPTRAARLAG